MISVEVVKNGISFGATLIAFGLMIWFFFNDNNTPKNP